MLQSSWQAGHKIRLQSSGCCALLSEPQGQDNSNARQACSILHMYQCNGCLRQRLAGSQYGLVIKGSGADVQMCQLREEVYGVCKLLWGFPKAVCGQMVQRRHVREKVHQAMSCDGCASKIQPLQVLQADKHGQPYSTRMRFDRALSLRPGPDGVLAWC